MICLEAFIKSLKITWVRRMIMTEDNVSWIELLKSTLPHDFESMFKFGNAYMSYLSSITTNLFWKDVFLSHL